MMIRNSAKDLSEPKTLKVTLPTKLHLQLHQLKILGGQTISETVQAALETHFDRIRGDPDETPGSQA